MLFGAAAGTHLARCSGSGMRWHCGELATDNGSTLVPGYVLVSRPDSSTVDYQLQVRCQGFCYPEVIQAVSVPPLPGQVHVDDLLTAPVVAWSSAPTSVGYRWLRDGLPIAGATSATYRVASADLGRELSFEATPVRRYFDGRSTVSAPVVVRIGLPPVSRTAPSVLGKVRVGRTVRAGVGTWSKPPSGFHYEWFVGGKRVGTSTKLVIKKKWRGKSLRLRVTALRAGCSPASAYSAGKRIKKRR